MNALFYKGEDILITFKSSVDLSAYTKVVKFFTPLSAVKTATVTAIDNYSFSAKLASADTEILLPGRLNIILELTGASNKIISKSIECQIADAYTDGGTRAKVTNAFDIVFAQGQEIIIDFVGATMLSDAITKAEQATIAANEAAGDAIEINNSIVSAEQLRATAELSRSSAESARASAEAARNVASNVYNITLAVPLAAGTFYTSTTARAAVPTAVRKRGLELIYETSAGVWYRERFIGASTTTWTTATDWELVPTKKDIDTALGLKTDKTALETTEEVAAQSLVELKERIDALEELIKQGILNNIIIKTLSVEDFQLNGASLILTGADAPAVTPDFIGQFYIKTTATTACYQSTGTSAVGDWKQIG